MSSFKSTLFAAAAALLATANAHIIMESPVPYSNDKIDNSPITAAQYPCKIQNGFTVTQMNNMAVGETQKISFKGTAVHGGGSCQLSYTQDTEPTEASVFKVIKSIEGGCPGLDGSTKVFEFTLPKEIPNGKGTFAWTWNPVSSGGPELYMNCAPIEVTGGASDASGLSSLPDMLRANQGDCTQVVNTVLKYPNPGQVLEANADATAPTGNCGSTGSTPPSSPPSGGASSAPAADPSPAPVSSVGGGFAPSALPTVQSTQTTLVTVTAAPSAPAASAPAASAPAVSAPAVSAPAAQPSAPSTPPTTGGSACSSNGAVVCNGPNQFGLCNNGQVVWQPVAAGTTCSNGAITKRSYSNRMVRRVVY